MNSKFFLFYLISFSIFVSSFAGEPGGELKKSGEGLNQVFGNPLIIIDGFEQRIKPLRGEDYVFITSNLGYTDSTTNQIVFNTSWNSGFAVGYVGMGVVEGIVVSKGAGLASGFLKTMSTSGRLASLTNKLTKAGRTVNGLRKSAAANQLLIGAGAVGGSYLLNDSDCIYITTIANMGPVRNHLF